MRKKRYQEALKTAKCLQKVSSFGNYNGYLVEIQIYLSQNNIEALIQAFDKLIQEDKASLSANHRAYQFAQQMSLKHPKLMAIYKKYR